MGTFWSSIKKGIEQGVKSVSEKTEELTKIGRLKIEVIAVKRDIEKTFVELGGRVYDMLQKDKRTSIAKDEAIIKLVDEVKQQEKKLKELEQRIQHIQDMNGSDVEA